MRERFKFDASLFCIAREQGHILAVRRSQTGWMDGFWSLPAGAHDGNESYRDGALRELREETGLIGKPEACFLVHVQQVFTSKTEWQALYFSVDVFNGTPLIAEPHKHDRVEWRSLLETNEKIVPYVRAALVEIARGSIYSTFRMDAD